MQKFTDNSLSTYRCINFPTQLEIKHLFRWALRPISSRYRNEKVLRETPMYKSSYMISLCRFLCKSRQFDWIFKFELQCKAKEVRKSEGNMNVVFQFINKSKAGGLKVTDCCLQSSIRSVFPNLCSINSRNFF